jgi:hypothetical protein
LVVTAFLFIWFISKYGSVPEKRISKRRGKAGGKTKVEEKTEQSEEISVQNDIEEFQRVLCLYLNRIGVKTT